LRGVEREPIADGGDDDWRRLEEAKDWCRKALAIKEEFGGRPGPEMNGPCVIVLAKSPHC
jgi:hypothetical protein